MKYTWYEIKNRQEAIKMENAVIIKESVLDTEDNPKRKRRKGRKKGKMPAAAMAGLRKYRAYQKSKKSGSRRGVSRVISSKAAHVIIPKADLSSIRHNLVRLGKKTRLTFTRTGAHTATRTRDRRAIPYTLNPFHFKTMHITWQNAVGIVIVGTMGFVTIDIITNYLPDAVKKPNAFRLATKAAIGAGVGWLISRKSKPMAVFFILGVGLNIIKDLWDTLEVSKMLPKLPNLLPAAQTTTTQAAAQPSTTSAISVGERKTTTISRAPGGYSELTRDRGMSAEIALQFIK
jgi:hypothetical protein